MADIIPFPNSGRVTAPSAEPCFVIFRAPSDSMAPTIAAGDIVEIDQACNRVDVDGVYLVDFDGAPAVRRIQRLPHGRARLSIDSAPGDAELVDHSTLRILGRVARYWTERRA